VTRKRELRLHIGAPRTGTTFVQQVLATELLKGSASFERTVVTIDKILGSSDYQRPAPTYGVLDLGLPCNLSHLCEDGFLEIPKKALAEGFEQIALERSGTGSIIVASAEHFFSDPSLIAELNLGELFDLKLYLCLRDPLDHVESLIKHFGSRLLPDEVTEWVLRDRRSYVDLFRVVVDQAVKCEEVNVYCFNCQGALSRLIEDLSGVPPSQFDVSRTVNQSSPAWFWSAMMSIFKEKGLRPLYGISHLWSAVCKHPEIRGLHLLHGQTSVFSRDGYSTVFDLLIDEALDFDDLLGTHLSAHMKSSRDLRTELKYRDEIPDYVFLKTEAILESIEELEWVSGEI
jgi:hypothetical protein